MAADPLDIMLRFESMKTSRGVLESHLEEVAEYIAPRNIGFTSKPVQGEKRMTKVFDNTALTSLNLLAAGLHGMATNPSMSWFVLGLADPSLMDDDEVKNWLSDTTRIMRSHMYAPGSNITTAFNEAYADLGAFGTAAMYIGLRKNGGLLYQSRPLAQIYIAENDEGVVDTLAYRYEMSARNVFKLWPKDAPDSIVKMAKDPKQMDTKVYVIYFVQPRGKYDSSKLDPGNLPFEACYILEKEKTLLEESGYHEFPYAVPRWIKNAGEEWGRSPGMEALPDVKMLQEMMKTTIKAAQKIVDPPLLIPDDGHIGPVKTYPGAFNYYRGDKEISPLVTNANIPLSLEMMENIRNRIRNTFYVDMLQFTTDTTMTATEVTQRTQERLRLLGPVIGRLEGEFIGATIVRTFGLLYRAKKLPPAPEKIQGQQFTVQFVSPIAMAQKQTETQGLAQLLQFVLPLAERMPEEGKVMIEPLKIENVTPWLAERFNVDPDLIRTKDEREQREAERKQEQAAAQQAMAANSMADTAKKGAGAVKDLSAANAQGADISGAQAALAEMSQGGQLRN